MALTYKYTPIVDIFSDIVTAVRAEYDAANLLEPYYMYGHPLEIVNTLAEKTRNPDYSAKKFPLIALFQDFDEGLNVANRTATLHIVICEETDPKYNAADRYTNTFKPVLYPLWDLLIKYMRRSAKIAQIEFDYTKTDRLYWGRNGLYGNEGNIFNDYIDAIEIQNLQLEFVEQC